MGQLSNDRYSTCHNSGSWEGDEEANINTDSQYKWNGNMFNISFCFNTRELHDISVRWRCVQTVSVVNIHQCGNRCLSLGYLALKSRTSKKRSERLKTTFSEELGGLGGAWKKLEKRSCNWRTDHRTRQAQIKGSLTEEIDAIRKTK